MRTEKWIYVDRHTIKHCTDKEPREIELLPEVQPVWDLWSIRILGPGDLRGVRHGSCMHEELEGGISVEGGGETLRRMGNACGPYGTYKPWDFSTTESI